MDKIRIESLIGKTNKRIEKQGIQRERQGRACRLKVNLRLSLCSIKIYKRGFLLMGAGGGGGNLLGGGGGGGLWFGL